MRPDPPRSRAACASDRAEPNPAWQPLRRDRFREEEARAEGVRDRGAHARRGDTVGSETRRKRREHDGSRTRGAHPMVLNTLELARPDRRPPDPRSRLCEATVPSKPGNAKRNSPPKKSEKRALRSRPNGSALSCRPREPSATPPELPARLYQISGRRRPVSCSALLGSARSKLDSSDGLTGLGTDSDASLTNRIAAKDLCSLRVEIEEPGQI